jgi:hypothetical protein
MPIYSFQCITENGGCGCKFEHFILMSDYNPNNLPLCPTCNDFTFVKRDFGTDLPVMRMANQTLGSIAEANTAKMSSDEREARFYENNKYRFEGGTTPGLPDDMTRLRENVKFDIRGTGSKKKREINKRKK